MSKLEEELKKIQPQLNKTAKKIKESHQEMGCEAPPYPPLCSICQQKMEKLKHYRATIASVTGSDTVWEKSLWRCIDKEHTQKIPMERMLNLPK